MISALTVLSIFVTPTLAPTAIPKEFCWTVLSTSAYWLVQAPWAIIFVIDSSASLSSCNFARLVLSSRLTEPPVVFTFAFPALTLTDFAVISFESFSSFVIWARVVPFSFWFWIEPSTPIFSDFPPVKVRVKYACSVAALTLTLLIWLPS